MSAGSGSGSSCDAGVDGREGRLARLQAARLVADAVRDEGYLLYPYRATSRKNQARWQFGVLGPDQAAARGIGEEADCATECLLQTHGDGAGSGAQVTVHLRFLQLNARFVERADGGGFVPVDELVVDGLSWLSWDEAVDHEISLGPFVLSSLPSAGATLTVPVRVPGHCESELLREGGSVVGRVVRRRWPLRAVVHLSVTAVGYDRDVTAVGTDRNAVRDTGVGEVFRLTVGVQNTARPVPDAQQAIRESFIGTHLLLEAGGSGFLSLVDPPDHARAAASACVQRRCWPVLAGIPGDDDVVLVSPIILDDHPRLAEQSAGDLFDSTEIDEILTLRVMTMTEEEKAEARATDPRAGEIIDRCDAMSADDLQRLHGVLRDPHALDPRTLDPRTLDPRTLDPRTLDLRRLDPVAAGADDVPWWDPGADASVDPAVDTVIVGDVAVSAGSRVRLRPSRRADAQDLFFAGRTARVTAVHSDVDGGTHVAVVIEDDPAADLHDWYGRYLYFAPDEIEPLTAGKPDDREERP